MRILVCDDEPQILRALKVILRDAGYEAVPAATLTQARGLAGREPLDGAIVDVMLPDGSGIDLCRELRSASEMPVIVLSVLEDEDAKLAALAAGADDYLVKPFSPRELSARLEAVLRRVRGRPPETLELSGGLVLDAGAERATRHGHELGLTPTEYRLLAVLARHRPTLVRGSALLREVWGPGREHDLPLLRTHIANLRRKLAAGSAERGPRIETRTGVGYRLVD